MYEKGQCKTDTHILATALKNKALQNTKHQCMSETLFISQTMLMSVHFIEVLWVSDVMEQEAGAM